MLTVDASLLNVLPVNISISEYAEIIQLDAQPITKLMDVLLVPILMPSRLIKPQKYQLVKEFLWSVVTELSTMSPNTFAIKSVKTVDNTAQLMEDVFHAPQSPNN